MTNENQANNYYIIGFKNLNENDPETALQVFKKALNLCPNNEEYNIAVLLAKNFIKLSDNEKYSGDAYTETDVLKIRIYRIQLEKLINKNKTKIMTFVKDCNAYKDIFSEKEISEIELMQKLDPKNDNYLQILALKKHFEIGMKYFTKNQIKDALKEFNIALKMQPQNKEYQLMVNLAEYKLNDPYVFYKNGLNELKKDNFEEAQKWFEKALSSKQDDLFKEAEQVAKNKKINIATASKDILLTINCFDETKVVKIIKSRQEGQIWYDLDMFSSAFNIQPHELIDLQDKIEFPAKPKNTVSRKIEF